MILTLKLSPKLEQRLAEEAARRGQDVESVAVAALEDRFVGSPLDDGSDQRTPERMLAEFFARHPQRSPWDLAKEAKRQGVPVFSAESLRDLGPPPSDEEFDVDEFIAARKQWQWEGRPLGAGFADPEDKE